MPKNSNYVFSKREGWVYLVHAVGTTRYKIGRSTNLIQRYKVLQKQSPFPLKVLQSFHTPDAITDEFKLHQVFGSFRVYGEWFDALDKSISVVRIDRLLTEFRSCTKIEWFNSAWNYLELLGIDSRNQEFCTSFSMFAREAIYNGKHYDFFWETIEKDRPPSFEFWEIRKRTEFIMGVLDDALNTVDSLNYPNGYEEALTDEEKELMKQFIEGRLNLYFKS